MRLRQGLVVLAAAFVAALAGPGPAPAATDAWRPLTPGLLVRTEVGAARVGRYIYVVGGFTTSLDGRTNHVERYDIRRDRWKLVESMPIGVNHPAVTSYRGKVFVYGGFTEEGGITAALQRYDPERDRWNELPPSSRPRAAGGLGPIDGKLYAAAGVDSSTDAIRTLEVYDIGDRRWKTGPEMSVGRNHVGSMVAGGKLYVLAGRAGNTAVPSVAENRTVAERYDPKRRKWTTLPPMSTARSGIAAVNVRGKVVVFGGEETAGTIREVELFDPKISTWTSLPDMLTPRHGLGGVAKGRRVFALEGGPMPAGFFSNKLEYLDIRRSSAP